MACRGRYAPLVPRGHRRLGGRLTTVRRASRLSGSSGASARGAGSQGSVSSGIRSPPVRALAPASRTREPSELKARPEVYGLGCCPYTMPRHLPRRRTREPLLSIRRGARHGLSRFVVRGDVGHGVPVPTIRTYFKVAPSVVPFLGRPRRPSGPHSVPVHGMSLWSDPSHGLIRIERPRPAGCSACKNHHGEGDLGPATSDPGGL